MVTYQNYLEGGWFGNMNSTIWYLYIFFSQGAPGGPGQPPYNFQGYQAAYGAPPVQGQPNAPGGAIWMPAPPPIPNCPPGLEYLSQVFSVCIFKCCLFFPIFHNS